ncbi:cuticle collagen dpy-13-like isoform X1 [Symphalangus syndactylus]|uniref:cuticle collagen dpy-13-like isoform X1 n=1 Tax=Symphalangus syndactylus TaxID=9590 RepID=UPI00300719FE
MVVQNSTSGNKKERHTRGKVPSPTPCSDRQPSAWDRDPGEAPLPPVSTLGEPAALGRAPRTPGKETQRQHLPAQPVAGAGVQGRVGLAKGPQPASPGARAELCKQPQHFNPVQRGNIKARPSGGPLGPAGPSSLPAGAHRGRPRERPPGPEWSLEPALSRQNITHQVMFMLVFNYICFI